MQHSRQPEEPLPHAPLQHHPMCDKQHLVEVPHLLPINVEAAAHNKGAHRLDLLEQPVHHQGRLDQEAIALQHQVEAAALHPATRLLQEVVLLAVRLHEAVVLVVVHREELEDNYKS